MTDSKCGLCGEPMPPGEEMFSYHGYSGPCPKPPLPKPPTLREAVESITGRIEASAAPEWIAAELRQILKTATK